MDSPIIELWFWVLTDEITKRRRQTRYRVTEQDAAERFGVDAVKVEGSIEIRRVTGAHTGDFFRRSH